MDLEGLGGGLHAFEDVDATAAATGLASLGPSSSDSSVAESSADTRLIRLAEGLREAGGEEGGFGGVLSRFGSS